VICLRNVLAIQRAAKDPDDRGLELIYDSSEAKIAYKFYNGNEDIIVSWITSLNNYNG